MSIVLYYAVDMSYNKGMNTGVATKATWTKNVFGKGPKVVRPMSKTRAAAEFPGYSLNERLAVTAYIEHQAHEALRRDDTTTYEAKMQVVRSRAGRGLSADGYAGPMPWLMK